ncbi:DUF4382 domain-containing protein [Parabacteroides sp. OttesenSCG-928-G07]|nr:DUF4382 domain-containing protein [Parabacteroides sp. OttesenSCG-928-G07]
MKKVLLIGGLFAALLIGCSDDDNKTDNKAGNARIEVRLTDAPAEYDEVNVEIIGISIHLATSDPELLGEWRELPMEEPGIYNLLDYRNGVDTLLAAQDIPTGKISQIRLLLGDNNTLVKEGITYDLKTPSAQQSGLKLNFHDELFPNTLYKLWIDFDASRSIVETGSGKYQLKPVIRAYAEVLSSTGIHGTINPADAFYKISAVLGEDTLCTRPNRNGQFTILGMTPSSAWEIYGYSSNEELYPNYHQTAITIKEGEILDYRIELE